MKLKDPCREVRAAHDSGKRPGRPTLIVIHGTEGSTAAGAAGWFRNPDSQGSAHKVVDARECYRCVPDDVIAWAAPPLNEEGLHIEFAAMASWSRSIWLSREKIRAFYRGAYHVARWTKEFDIPLSWLSTDELRAGKRRGLTTHRRVTFAFGESSHTCPGVGFPERAFMKWVRYYRRRM